MSKQKYAQHVLDNIAWFDKYGDEFSFDGNLSYFLKKIHCYKRKIGSDNWTYENSMSESSFKLAFGDNVPYLLKDKTSEWKLEKETEDCIVYDINGVDAIEAFIQIDSYGVVKPTREPDLLFRLLRSKASLNLHIKMYAEDRANGRLPKLLFDEIAKEFEFKDWMIDAVEHQKWQYVK